MVMEEMVMKCRFNDLTRGKVVGFWCGGAGTREEGMVVIRWRNGICAAR